MNIIGIIVGVAIVAGLVAAMGKMSDHGADANGCGGNCSHCGIPQELRDCSEPGNTRQETRRQRD